MPLASSSTLMYLISNICRVLWHESFRFSDYYIHILCLNQSFHMEIQNSPISHWYLCTLLYSLGRLCIICNQLSTMYHSQMQNQCVKMQLMGALMGSKETKSVGMSIFCFLTYGFHWMDGLPKQIVSFLELFEFENSKLLLFFFPYFLFPPGPCFASESESLEGSRDDFSFLFFFSLIWVHLTFVYWAVPSYADLDILIRLFNKWGLFCLLKDEDL